MMILQYIFVFLSLQDKIHESSVQIALFSYKEIFLLLSDPEITIRRILLLV